ncbi:MAG: thiamine pyrophosphate-dependent enzyme [Patescibacteria group bacterium]
MEFKSNFCPGCGQVMILQALYKTLQDLKKEDKAVLGLDIGCSLLAWNFLPINTFQTHHGRVAPTMVGYKKANPDSISIAYTGDGGAYAIGLQSLLWTAKRNEAITVIVVNNSIYAMTGGQTAPTTLKGQKTDTSPQGFEGESFLGPELLRSLNKKAFLTRTSCNDIKDLKRVLSLAIKNQLKGNFSLIEILSFCPTNWKTKGKATIDYLENMKKTFPIGEIE